MSAMNERAADRAADRAAVAILETVPATMRALRQRMRGGPQAVLSVPQFRLLGFVRRHPGTSLSPVAEHLGTSLPAASQLAERLVRAGLISRTASPTERRRVELRLTEAGARVLSERDARTRAWLGELLEDLDEERLARLIAALEDLRSVVSADQG
jgi:DNA-binding MarR family transcriptional regulator